MALALFAGLAANGARVVVAGCSLGMVIHGLRNEDGWRALPTLALPFRDGSFDAVIAGFLLNHVAPALALIEMSAHRTWRGSGRFRVGIDAVRSGQTSHW